LVNKGSTLGANTGFQRSFFIFSNEDRGYEAGQKPSGHIKLEVREGRGKLHATVQNLQPGNGRFVYRLYLLEVGSGEVRTAYVGQLTPEPNKAELEWSFDPQNVGATGIAIDDFDAAVVLVEHEHADYAVICPLVAYMGRKMEWRNGLRTALAKKSKGNENSVNSVEVPVYEKKPNGTDGMKVPLNEELQAGVPTLPQEYIVQNYMPLEQTVQEYSAYGQIMQDNLQQENISQKLPSKDQNVLYDWQQSPYEQENLKQQSPYEQEDLKQQPPYEQENLKQQSPYEQEDLKQQSPYEQENPMQQPPYEQVPQQDMQYQGMQGQIDTGCVYLNGNICGAFVNTGIGAANPCAACHLHHGRPNYTEPPAGDVSQLREELDRYFEQCDPFHSNRSDYMWWRVSNPVNLNNMLYQCNVRSPLLFNPEVMMAHYKYRHLIVGIFLHRAKEKQYIVCGVPGMSMVDRKPFGDMSRWVQAEGNRPRYGAFGYWLVYIDPDGGKILNMSQE
jgi:hypothetical protein